jgi:hypothetical protein
MSESKTITKSSLSWQLASADEKAMIEEQLSNGYTFVTLTYDNNNYNYVYYFTK